MSKHDNTAALDILIGWVGKDPRYRSFEIEHWREAWRVMVFSQRWRNARRRPLYYEGETLAQAATEVLENPGSQS